MSQQGPLLVVSSAGRPSFATALDEARTVSGDRDRLCRRGASRRSRCSRPRFSPTCAASITRAFEALAKQIAARKPYLPLIAVEPESPLPDNAIPFSSARRQFRPPDRAPARGAAGPRVACRRCCAGSAKSRRSRLPETDPAREATVLLIGRGGAYPALSVALGERLGVVGAFSIEAAANHLNTRDIDGIVLGEGFTPRVVDAFLTVLSEDARFRNLPVVLTTGDLAPSLRAAQSRNHHGRARDIAANALPLIRQHAFEARLEPHACARSMPKGCSIRRPACSSKAAFDRDFANAVAPDARATAAACRSRASPSMPTIPARNSMARGSSAG